MVFVFINAIENKEERDLATDLYKKYRNVIYNIGKKFFYHNHDDAEDVVSATVERICNNISQFKGLNEEGTRVMINIYGKSVATDLYRKRNFIKFEELDDSFAAEERVEDTFVKESDYQKILEIVEGLEPQFADVCKLKFFSGLHDKEIAAALGITHRAVRNRLSRSRQMIAQKLKETGIEI